MAASVTVTLDVTPPQVVLGLPARLPSQRVTVPYLITEPALDTALVDAIPASFDAERITSTQTYPAAGNLEVTGTAVDDVGNAAPFGAILFIGPPAGTWHGPGQPANSDRVEVG